MSHKQKGPTVLRSVLTVSGPEAWEKIGRFWVFKPFVPPAAVLSPTELEAIPVGTAVWVAWSGEREAHLQVILGYIKRHRPSRRSGTRNERKDPILVSWWEFCQEGRKLINLDGAKQKLGNQWKRYFINRMQGGWEEAGTHRTSRVWLPTAEEMKEIESRSPHKPGNPPVSTPLDRAVEQAHEEMKHLSWYSRAAAVTVKDHTGRLEFEVRVYYRPSATPDTAELTSRRIGPFPLRFAPEKK